MCYILQKNDLRQCEKSLTFLTQTWLARKRKNPQIIYTCQELLFLLNTEITLEPDNYFTAHKNFFEVCAAFKNEAFKEMPLSIYQSKVAVYKKEKTKKEKFITH